MGKHDVGARNDPWIKGSRKRRSKELEFFVWTVTVP
jgi:hypothetical protein